jgi:hypothetical protein
MLLVAAAVVVFKIFSFITKLEMVMKSDPMILKIASFRLPAVPAGLGAVMVLPLPAMVTRFVLDAPVSVGEME